MRGTPHYHILISVKRDAVEKSDIESKLPEVQKKVTDLVKTVITANLVEAYDSEFVPYMYHCGDNETSEDQKVGNFI